MSMRTVVLLSSLVLLQTNLGRADETLTEAAQRERERRATQKAQKVKKFTDDDLKKLPSKNAPASETPDAAATTDQGSGVDMSGSEESNPEFWRPRIDEARGYLRAREAAVHELEARIQELRAEFSQPVRLTEPNRERRIANDISALATELDTARQSVEEAKQALEDLLEEARRAGVAASQLD